MLDNIEALANGEGSRSCSATADCYGTKLVNGQWQEVKIGSVSCTGEKECESGEGYATCDGTTAKCN